MSLITRKAFVEGVYSTMHEPVPLIVVLNKIYARSMGAPPGLAVENRAVNVCDKPEPAFGVRLTTVGVRFDNPLWAMVKFTPLTEIKPVRATPGLGSIVNVIPALVVPVAALVIVIHESLAVAVHGQLVVLTIKDPRFVVGPNEAEPGDTVRSQPETIVTNAS